MGFGDFGAAGGGNGAPKGRAKAVAGSATGPVYSISRLLGASSTLALIAGTNANLTLSGANIVAATALGNASQTAIVRESNGALAVEYPVVITGQTVVTRPDAPTLAVTPGNGQANLTFSDGSDGGGAITGHKIYRGPSPGALTLLTTITSGSPYVDTGLTNGTLYYYAISAVNSAGEGAESTIQSTTPTGLAAPTALATVNPTSNLLDHQPFQADTLIGGGQGVGQGTVGLSFSAVAQPGTIHARCSSGGATRGDVQAPWIGATIATTGAQTVNITGVDAGLRWFYLDIGVSDGAGGVTWQNGTVLIGMGDLTFMTGQSLGVYFIFNNDIAWSNAAAKAANNGNDLSLDPNLQYTRIFATCESYSSNTVAGLTWQAPGSGPYLSAGAAKYLTVLAAQTGRVQGLAGHVSSGTYQSYWQRVPTGAGNAGYTQAAKVFNAAGGKFRIMKWWQGHADAESSVPAAHYANDMDVREFGAAGFSTLNTYPRANVIRLVQTIPNINISGGGGTYYYGPMRNANAIRKGAKDWCAAKNDGTHTNGVYVEMPGLNLAFDPHPGTIGCIEAAKCSARAVVGDNLGPSLVSAARDAANPNDLILTFDRALVTTGSWWTRPAVYIAGSTQNLVLCASGVPQSSTQLRVTLTPPTGGAWAVGDSFDVYMGAPWDGDRTSDPSGNMIRDTRTDTIDPANGRPFQTNQVPVNAPRISAGATTPTANYPTAYKAPSSINDIVLTTPTFDTVEHLAGFGLPLIGGTGTTRTNQAALNNHGMVAFGVGITMFARFRTPAAPPASNKYIFKVGGAGPILNNSSGNIKLLGTGDNLSGAVTSATILPNKVYWVAVVISPAGAVKMYWYNCTDTGQSVQLIATGTTNKNYSIGNGLYSIGDFFTGTTGASLMEVGVYDTDTIYTGAAGSFTPPAAPLVGNEPHLVFYDRTVAANNASGVLADLVRAL